MPPGLGAASGAAAVCECCFLASGIAQVAFQAVGCFRGLRFRFIMVLRNLAAP